MSRRTIGLLGGSFNPAHAGHLHLSLHALKALGLDEVWWLVSPQNPLKSSKDMADFATRFAHAQRIASACPRIRLSDFEHQRGLHYTFSTVAALQQTYPHCRFIWLMGADNLAQFHRWKRWRNIATRLPIAVFDRAPYSHRALRSKAAITLQSCRAEPRLLRHAAPRHLPAWSYVFMRRHPQSASALRFALGKDAFLSDN